MNEMSEWVTRILSGDVVEVLMENGNMGVVFVQRGSYDEQFIFQVTDGWCAGLTEPICDTNSNYIATFLQEAVSVSSTTRRVPPASCGPSSGV